MNNKHKAVFAPVFLALGTNLGNRKQNMETAIENIEKQRDHLLNVQYDVETVNVSDYRFLPASAIEEFIDSVVNEIAETIELWQTEYSGEGSFLLRRKPNR